MNQSERDLKKLSRLLNFGCLAATVAIGAAICFPGITSLNRMGEDDTRQTKRLQKMLRNANLEEVELTRLNSKLVASMETLRTRTQNLPATPDLEGFAEIAARNATDAGLQLVDLRPGETETVVDHQRGTVIAQLTATMVCSGDYPAICKFIEAVQSLPAHVSIKELQITRSDENNDEKIGEKIDESQIVKSLLTIDFALQFAPEQVNVQ